MFNKIFTLLLFNCIILKIALSAEESFLLIDGKSSEIVLEIGSHIDERETPRSTFKIALSLIGFDSGILQDENNPVWQYQEGYDDYLESWKRPQTPLSWIKNSCLWFSKRLAERLEMHNFQFYLTALDYGNQDASGGLTNACWLTSLKISPREQVTFIQKMLQHKHPVSSYAIQMTRQLLFLEELPNGWKLFGKTGSGFSNQPDGKNELGWFVGWVEKGDDFLPFAYKIRENKIDPQLRIPRVKQFLVESELRKHLG